MVASNIWPWGAWLCLPFPLTEFLVLGEVAAALDGLVGVQLCALQSVPATLASGPPHACKYQGLGCWHVHATFVHDSWPQN